MADLDDVMNALTSLIAGVIYPNGTGNASVVGAPVKIYPGWPVPNVLDDDIKAGHAHVSIFPRPEERNTTRHATAWQDSTVDLVAGTGTAVKVVGEQERLFQIVIWAPTPAVRTAITKAVDPALRQAGRLAMPDNTYARLVYRSSPMTDMLQKSTIYRRDLFYTVEYATTVTGAFYPIKTTTINLTHQ